MPGIRALVQLISDAVVTDLANGGQLPLTAGKILLGRQHHLEQTDAPRILFVPVSSSFGPKDLASPVPLRPMTERVIGTDFVTFEVRCWGRGVNDVRGGTDPDADFDATQTLYQSVLGQIHETCNGCYEFGPLTWTDSKENASQIVRRGREAVFTVTIATPVYARTSRANLQSPVPAPDPPSNYVPPGTEPTTTVTLTDPTGLTGTETIIGD